MAFTVFATAGCKETPTSILLEIRAAKGVAVDELQLTVYDDSGIVVERQRLPETGVPELPDTVALFPRYSGQVRLHLLGKWHNIVAGEGATVVEVRSGEQVKASVTLTDGLLPDGDKDGVPDIVDNCPTIPNPDQLACATSDGPSVGDGSRDMGADLAPDGLPPSSITVTAPASGAVWGAGSSQTISWSATGVSQVILELWKGSSKIAVLASGVSASNGSYSWDIDSAISWGDDYRIKAINADNSADSGLSGDFTINNWRYMAPVSIDATGAPSNLTDYQVAVTLTSSSFAFAHAKSTGADLRFSSNPSLGSAFDLPHWIESWSASAAKIWVKVPSITSGQTKAIYLFYGNTAAQSASSQSSTFPNAFVSSADLTLTGNKTYDWFELKSTHTLTVGAGQLLSIKARRILMDGTIDGVGKGHAGGAADAAGSGPGGGGTTPNAAAGGGGHGGKGGDGSYDTGDTVGVGGPANGSTANSTNAMGSGGGGSADCIGGGGGGAVTLSAHDIVVAGSIVMDGEPGQDGDTTATDASGGGGGAGGGIVLEGVDITVTGNCSASGGTGGLGPASWDGAGGGSGGRFKAFSEDSYDSSSGTVSVDGGVAGAAGASDVPGEDGAKGTSHTGTKTYELAPTSVGAETTL